MTKVEWLRNQIKAASEGFPDLDAHFIPKLVAAVEAAGEGITRSEFMRLFESFAPSDAGPAHCDYMMLDTQLSYAADFSEAWDIPKIEALPEVSTRAQIQGVELPGDFLKLGGEPDWIQDEGFPICDGCDRDMVLFAQLKSLPDLTGTPDLSAYRFGDMGNLYVLSCRACGTFKVDMQSH